MSRGVPVSVVDVSCVACSTMYVATGADADELDALPAMTRLHRRHPLGPDREPVGFRPASVTPDDAAGIAAVAGRQASRLGWVRRPDGGWACPRHAAAFGGTGTPRRFTVVEVITIHRALREESEVDRARCTG